jgi:hypothetical protein
MTKHYERQSGSYDVHQKPNRAVVKAATDRLGQNTALEV